METLSTVLKSPGRDFCPSDMQLSGPSLSLHCVQTILLWEIGLLKYKGRDVILALRRNFLACDCHPGGDNWV